MDSLINSDQTEKYNLDKGKNYNYLPASPAHTPSDNVDKLREVKEAFHVLDFALEDQETIVKILAAILLIGQIQFKPDELEDSNSGVEIQNMDVVDKSESPSETTGLQLEFITIMVLFYKRQLLTSFKWTAKSWVGHLQIIVSFPEGLLFTGKRVSQSQRS